MTTIAKFHWADYLVFAISLALSILVGVIFAIKDKWTKQSAESYLMANRRMNWILVGLSFWATVVDASFFIGLTAEFYYFDMTILWVIIARYLGGTFTMLFVIPKFYRLGFKMTSAYEYFEFRFNLPVRVTVSVIYFITTLFSSAISLYGPSLVLSAVTGLDLYWCIFIGAAVCFIYTTFGGMKAVIWVDAIQVFIMVFGMCFLAGKGMQAAGGLEEAWRIYNDIGERGRWNDVNPNPWNRHSVLNVIFLMTFTFAGMFSTTQSVLQRYLTIPKMQRAQWAVFFGITLGIGFTAIPCFIGMAAFANVGGNEPMLNVKDQKPDKILGYFLMSAVGDLHGVPGLVVASLFAAGLSSLSSSQNALAAIVTKDFVQAIHRSRGKKSFQEKTLGIISRTAGVIIGLIAMGLALVVPFFQDTLLSLVLSLTSILSGPILGLLIVGFFCFWVEAWGALVGLLMAFGWGLMMFFGGMFASNRSAGLGMDRAPWFNNNFTSVKRFPEPDVTPTLFDTSYTWYVLMGVVVVLIVANIISLIVHCVRYRGRIPWTAVRPHREMRYTMDDFREAVRCKQDKESYNFNDSITKDDFSLKTDMTSDRDSCNIAVLSVKDLALTGIENQTYRSENDITGVKT